MRLCPFAILPLLGLVSCVIPAPMFNPPVVRQPVPGITMPVQNGNQADNEGFAREYCSEYAAWAHLEMVNYGTIEPLLSYSCN
jgi:hypothetical protein